MENWNYKAVSGPKTGWGSRLPPSAREGIEDKLNSGWRGAKQIQDSLIEEGILEPGGDMTKTIRRMIKVWEAFEFQADIEKALTAKSARTFIPKEWTPWEGPSLTSIDRAFLFGLNRVSMENRSQPLWRHEAVWATKWRSSLDGLSDDIKMDLIELYGFREEIAFNLGNVIYTADLDAIIEFQTWIGENARDYYRKMIEGLIHIPSFVIVTDIAQMRERFEFVEALGLDGSGWAVRDPKEAINPEDSVFMGRHVSKEFYDEQDRLLTDDADGTK